MRNISENFEKHFKRFVFWKFYKYIGKTAGGFQNDVVESSKKYLRNSLKILENLPKFRSKIIWRITKELFFKIWFLKVLSALWKGLINISENFVDLCWKREWFWENYKKILRKFCYELLQEFREFYTEFYEHYERILKTLSRKI